MTINEQVEMYYKLNEQSKAIEKQMKEIRPVIETYVATKLDNAKLTGSITFMVDSYAITLSPAARENFNLKMAKLEMPSAIIDPYITRSEFTTLKIMKVSV